MHNDLKAMLIFCYFSIKDIYMYNRLYMLKIIRKHF